MELKDVIHMHLGCQFQVATKDAPEELFIGEMVDVSNSNSNHSRWIKVNFGSVIKVFRDGDKIGSNMHHFFVGYDNIKPILRKLEDMTEEEGGAIFQLERNRLAELGGHDFDVRKADKGWIITRLDMLEQHLMVSFHGQIYWVYDVPKQRIEPSNNQELIFHHLLSCGFDLFNLIPSGQAIDATTLNQPNKEA